jgi:hypothetical protein
MEFNMTDLVSVISLIFQLGLGFVLGAWYKRSAIYHRMQAFVGMKRYAYIRALWPNVRYLEEAIDETEQSLLESVAELAIQISARYQGTELDTVITRMCTDARLGFSRGVDLSLFLNDDGAAPARAKQRLEEKS